MASNIANEISVVVPFDSYFLSNMEMMIPYFMKPENHRVVNIEPAIAYKYIFDLEGLLRHMFNIPREHVPMNIFLNGYNSSSDYKGDRLSLYIANEGELSSFIISINKNKN